MDGANNLQRGCLLRHPRLEPNTGVCTIPPKNVKMSPQLWDCAIYWPLSGLSGGSELSLTAKTLNTKVTD